MDENANKQITLLESLNSIIHQAKESAKSTINAEGVHQTFIQLVNRFFYSNLFNIFQNNLYEPIADEFEITEKIKKEIEDKFSTLFTSAQENLSDVFDLNLLDEKGDDLFEQFGSLDYEEDEKEEDDDFSIDRGINRESYSTFGNKIKNIDQNAFRFLRFVEAEIEMEDCEKSLTKFEAEIENLGLELKFDQDGLGFNIDFDD